MHKKACISAIKMLLIARACEIKESILTVRAGVGDRERIMKREKNKVGREALGSCEGGRHRVEDGKTLCEIHYGCVTAISVLYTPWLIPLLYSPHTHTILYPINLRSLCEQSIFSYSYTFSQTTKSSEVTPNVTSKHTACLFGCNVEYIYNYKMEKKILSGAPVNTHLTRSC